MKEGKSFEQNLPERKHIEEELGHVEASENFDKEESFLDRHEQCKSLLKKDGGLEAKRILEVFEKIEGGLKLSHFEMELIAPEAIKQVVTDMYCRHTASLKDNVGGELSVSRLFVSREPDSITYKKPDGAVEVLNDEWGNFDFTNSDLGKRGFISGFGETMDGRRIELVNGNKMILDFQGKPSSEFARELIENAVLVFDEKEKKIKYIAPSKVSVLESDFEQPKGR